MKSFSILLCSAQLILLTQAPDIPIHHKLIGGLGIAVTVIQICQDSPKQKR